MAIGKGNKKGRKGGRKKIIEPMTRKDWYDVQVPATFAVRKVGKTLVNRTSGLKTATDALIGRVFECNLADLNNDESVSFRKMKFACEEVQGNTLLTNFHGMDLTRDKLCSLVKKWHSLVEAWCDVKTTDGYVLRLFCIGFTKRRHKQVSKTSYAQGGHIRAIRKRMIEIMTAKASKVDLHTLVAEFIPESIGHDIMIACNSIYPLNNVFIRKCKVLRKPKFDLQRLLEVHEGGAVSGSGAAADEDALVEGLDGTGGRL